MIINYIYNVRVNELTSITLTNPQIQSARHNGAVESPIISSWIAPQLFEEVGTSFDFYDGGILPFLLLLQYSMIYWWYTQYLNRLITVWNNRMTVEWGIAAKTIKCYYSDPWKTRWALSSIPDWCDYGSNEQRNRGNYKM